MTVISLFLSMMNLFLVLVGSLFAMVIVSSTSIEAACAAFSDGLKNLVSSEGTNHASKACLICDCLLEWNDNGFLTKARLKNLKERLSGEGVEFNSLHPDLKEYYCYKGRDTKHGRLECFYHFEVFSTNARVSIAVKNVAKLSVRVQPNLVG
jgi:hypothetical protein